ncbi:MAG: hypothetical protein LBL87_03050 [Ruminococcus sp.]|jgi:hypothetical protein|nr:hypothetical protein [Ruminococcus sp.]
MPQYGFHSHAVTVHEPPPPVNFNEKHICVINGTAKIPETRFEKLSQDEARRFKTTTKCAPHKRIYTPAENHGKSAPLLTICGKSFDKDSVLVLALAAILLREKADIKLIIALVYLAF